jgi:hypothetical protein
MQRTSLRPTRGSGCRECALELDGKTPGVIVRHEERELLCSQSSIGSLPST